MEQERKIKNLEQATEIPAILGGLSLMILPFFEGLYEVVRDTFYSRKKND